MPIAPKESPEYNLLLSLASQAGLSRAEVRNILWLLNSHERLIGFPTVFNRLHYILIQLQTHANVQLADYGLEKWPQILPSLVAHSQEWAAQFPRPASIMLPRYRRRKHPMSREGLRKNGLYSILFNEHADHDISDPQGNHLRFTLMQGHFVLAHILAVRALIPIAKYEEYTETKIFDTTHSMMYAASKAIRDLSRRENIDYLREFNPFQDFKHFRASLRIFTFDHSIKIERYLNSYKAFICKSWGQGVGRLRAKLRHGSAGGGGVQIPGHVGIYSPEGWEYDAFADQDDPLDNWGSMESVSEYMDKSILLAEEEEALEQDIHPAELFGEDEIILTDYDCPEEKNMANYSLSVRGQLRHRKMANQFFPWAYQTLTATEGTVLMHAIFRELHRLFNVADWAQDQQLEMESLIILNIIFWTGASLERAISTRLIAPSPDDTHHESQNNVCWNMALMFRADDRAESEWRIKTICPQHYHNVSSAKEQTREITEYIQLPDLYGTAGQIKKLLVHTKGDLESSEPIFRFTTQEYRQRINDFLSSFTCGERITIAKIRNYLFNYLIQTTGDIPTAAAITATRHPLNRVRSFYFSPKVNFLRSIYQKAAFDIGSLFNISPTTRAANDEGSNICIGAKNCATIEAVQTAVSRMRNDLDKLGKAYQEEPEKYHNLYTLYTVLLFGYSTGMRAVTSPIITSRMVYNAAELAIIADKEDQFHSKSRPVWIPPLLREQLNNYERHCQAISEILPIDLAGDLLPPCYFINDAVPQEVRPKLVASRMRQYIDVPANAQRRFLQTNLIERGCPSEVVDAFMGHWFAGEEPWSQYSTLALRDHFACLREYLLPILRELGWMSIRSPFQTLE